MLEVIEPKELAAMVQTEATAPVPAVKDQESLAVAGETAIGLKALRKQIVDYWRDPKEAAHKAHKSIVSKEAEMLGPVDKRIKAIESSVSEYLTEQRRLQQAEQARLDRERADREAKKKEKLRKQAEKAAEKGQTEKAEALLDRAEALHIPAAIVESAPKTTKTDAGSVSSREELVIEVTDLKALCAEIAAGRAPVHLVVAQPGKLKEFVKQWAHNSFPGLRIAKETRGTFRGAA